MMVDCVVEYAAGLVAYSTMYKIIILLSTYTNTILSTSLLSKYQHCIVFVKDNYISTLQKDN